MELRFVRLRFLRCFALKEEEKMGAVAIREHEPMVNETLTEQLVESDAARQAVSDVPSKIMSLGGTNEQANAMAEAMRLVLLGQEKPARLVLEKAGYPKDAIDVIMGHLGERLKSAA
jgi:hypothetical protein